MNVIKNNSTYLKTRLIRALEVGLVVEVGLLIPKVSGSKPPLFHQLFQARTRPGIEQRGGNN